MPFLLVRGAVHRHGEAAGGVEDDRVVGEPPVAVDGAAGAGERILAQREIEAGFAQGGGLARLGLTDEQHPRQVADAHLGSFERGHGLGPAFLDALHRQLGLLFLLELFSLETLY